jgi:large subunit ribosomal protein L29
MRAEKMRGLDGPELQRQSQESQEQLFRLRFQMGMGQTEGLKKYRNLKKDRARMLTVLNEKRAAGETIPEQPITAQPALETKKRRRFLFGRKKK